jgi:ribosomal protein S18 acetylase RimI-like enzyme
VSLFWRKVSTVSGEIAAALVRALSDDPFYRALTMDFAADATKRAALLARYFEYSLSEAEQFGRVVRRTTPGLGAAAWLLPQHADVVATVTRRKREFLSTILSPHAQATYATMVAAMAVHTHAVVPPTAWYLSILGVDPWQQGLGLGGLLLQPTLSEASAAGAICYLETFSTRAVPFYARHGFRLVGTYLESVTGCNWLVMRRDA